MYQLACAYIHVYNLYTYVYTILALYVIIGPSVFRAHGARGMPPEVIHMYLRAQWSKLNRLMRSNYTKYHPDMRDLANSVTGGPPYTCVPVRARCIRFLNEMIQRYIINKDVCQQIGCPETFPIVVDSTNTVYLPLRKVNITCIKIASYPS